VPKSEQLDVSQYGLRTAKLQLSRIFEERMQVMCFQLFNSLQTGETERINIEQTPHKTVYKTASNKRRLPLFLLGCIENRVSKLRKCNKSNKFSWNQI